MTKRTIEQQLTFEKRLSDRAKIKVDACIRVKGKHCSACREFIDCDLVRNKVMTTANYQNLKIKANGLQQV